MATITPRKSANGAIRYTAQIRLRRNGKIVYTESETFGKRALAEKWAAKRETELDQPGALQSIQQRGVTIGEIIRWYREDFGEGEFGRNKHSQLKFLEGTELAGVDAIELTTERVVEHVRQRRKGGTGPSTLNQEVGWLRLALKAARIGRGLPVHEEVVDDAAELLRQAKLIAKANKRERRPELTELDALMVYFDSRDGRSGIQMVDVVLFALFSARRQDEICRLMRSDYDRDRKRILVRKMKHPRQTVDTWVFLTDEAIAVLDRQPVVEGEDRFFPYNAKSVSAAFTRACHFLAIEDLRFHDLRHECASWLFELQWDIPRVAQVTGHRAWSTLQRYTHLRELGFVDKYDGWEWRPF